MNRSQLVSLIITPIVTGSTSFIASLTLIATVLRSNLKLTTIYRRFVFALSTFDLLQSLSQAASSVPMPRWTTVWLAIGNDTSCDIFAFLAVLGSCGAILYSLSLTIYFMLVIKYNMTDAKISELYEPYLHAVPILYTLTIAITIYASGNYNPAGPVCWINSEPINCHKNPDLPCKSWGNPELFKWLSAGAPVSLVLFINCIILGVIWRTVSRQTKKSESYRHSWMQSMNDNEENLVGDDNAITKFCPCLKLSKNRSEKTSQNESPLAARLSRPSKIALQRLKEISNRAFAYVIGYLLTYFFTFLYRVIEMAGAEVPFAIIFLSRFFYPLQGLFNVMIYSYPHVVSYRKKNPNDWWIRAFWEVVKSGGDSDDLQIIAKNPRRRQSLRKQQMILDQCVRRNSLREIPGVKDSSREIGQSSSPLIKRPGIDNENSATIEALVAKTSTPLKMTSTCLNTVDNPENPVEDMVQNVIAVQRKSRVQQSNDYVANTNNNNNFGALENDSNPLSSNGCYHSPLLVQSSGEEIDNEDVELAAARIHDYNHGGVEQGSDSLQCDDLDCTVDDSFLVDK